MKKIVSALMAVIMMFSVLCLSAYAQEEDPAYQSAFSDYLASDGAYAEKYAEALANMYQNNPEEFLKALSALSDEDVMQVSYALTGFIDLDSLAAQLNSFAITNIDSSSNALSIVREIVDTKIAEYASLAQEQYAGAPARHNRYLSSTNWSSGQDLDIYAQVRWNSNVPSIIAYVRNDGAKEPLSEVRMFYRTATSGAWTDGGVMSKSGDTYSYNFNGKFSTGTSVQWMVRLIRSGVTQAAFCPAKYYQPANNPNSTSNAYDFWTNTVT